MEIIKDPKVDWLSLKWIFIAVSILLILAGVVSLYVRGLNLGVDFSGGTLVYVRFREQPDLERIRSVLSQSDLRAEQVNRFDDPDKNQVQIKLARVESDRAEDLNRQNEQVLELLHQEFDSAESASGKLDLNNITKTVLAEKLEELAAPGSDLEAPIDYRQWANRVIDLRSEGGGVFQNFAELEALNLPPYIRQALTENFYLGSFNLISVESVGPKVGRELRERAQTAVLFSLLGMLAYIALRFQLIYGLAAIVALFHDVMITVGFFSIFDKEISLTVIAALLTLVGYSINDTIVVFDRVRENTRRLRRQDLRSIINLSINQTLNRTVLTSGMTFLAVFALYVFGGPVLNGFSFALVIGIIVGTYSSVAIASPIVLWWQNRRNRGKTSGSRT